MQEISKFMDDFITEDVAESILIEAFFDSRNGEMISKELNDINDKIADYTMKGKNFKESKEFKQGSRKDLIEIASYLNKNESAMGLDCGFTYVYLDTSNNRKSKLANKFTGLGYSELAKDINSWLSEYSGNYSLPYSVFSDILGNIYNNLEINGGDVNKEYSCKLAMYKLIRVQSVTYKELIIKKIIDRVNNYLGDNFFTVSSTLD